MVESSNPIPAVPATTCALCAAVTELSRRDITGRLYCEDCYQALRRTDDAEPVAFRCAVCGSPTDARLLDQLAGRGICRACSAGPPEPPGDDERATLGLRNDPPPNGVANRNKITGSAEHKPSEARILCPHCWHTFGPGQALWVAVHPDLLGDVLLGPEAMPRFLPSRFTTAGDALDLRDTPCQQIACPRCHLVVPRALVETQPLLLSIAGAPASGKSHFLAAMTWELRHVLAQSFGLTFNDAEPEQNRVVNEYEETLFLPDDVTRPVAIRKTELHGELYDSVMMGEQVVTLPRPFLFTLRPSGDGSGRAAKESADKVRVICLYDNAGEHFQPGMDSFTSPGTQHLVRSRAIMFLYDPTQDPRLRERCKASSNDPQLDIAARTQRQETILTEAAARVRRYNGAAVEAKDKRALLVLVSKADVWAKLIDLDLSREPITVDRFGKPAVDLGRIWAVSRNVRSLLKQTAPGLVAAAEDFSQHVVYVPVSALGNSPELDPAAGTLGIRPQNIRPRWVTAPMLYLLAYAKVPLLRSVRPADKRSRVE